MAPVIETIGLTKRYGPVLALDGLDLTVEPGEVFGFLGPNGAGKSTTIRLLLDLIRPTAGRALVMGHDCQGESVAVRSRIGYLPGDLRLYPGLTGRDTVDLIAGLRLQRVDWEFVHDLARRLDLDLDRRASSYSKGNRQKLGIALALLPRAPLLLLDEPTSGLDPIMQHTVWDILRAQTREGVTVFFSSHVMSEVDVVCDRAAILRRGRIVTVDTLAGLKSRAVRHVEVDFADAAPALDFRADGIREIRRERHTVEFEVTGDIDPLLKALACHHVTDLRSEQPTLDEILLGFYEGDGAPARHEAGS